MEILQLIDFIFNFNYHIIHYLNHLLEMLLFLKNKFN